MSRINCHSAFKHYEMFHSRGGDVINIGSNNTTIFNTGAGFGGGSFWSGFGYGLGNGLGSIFGGLFGGNMGGFSNFGFGMSPFGIGGFLFYAFLYGAMGALVSKTEDIQKSAGTLQMIIMVVYFAVLFQLQNVHGMIMKVCSFLPISSYSAMFVRIGMGKVETYEVIISAVILYASIIFTGWIGATIYRMGTLRYGNPIKLRNALKGLKDAE